METGSFTKSPAEKSRRGFIEAAGAFGAIALTACAYGCNSSANPAASSESSSHTYRSAAKAGFGVLARQYKSPSIFDGNFWFGGTTLHTCLNYMVAANETDRATKIVPAAFDVYQNLSTNPGWWRDDYGWWGVAFAFALEHRDRLGYQDRSHDELFAELAAAAQSCWQKISDNWRTTTYNRRVKGGTSDNAGAAAPIRGGTFNNSPDATNPPLSGRNSVTNEGFWILSQRLAKLNPRRSDYAQMAAAERDWFGKWLAYSSTNPGSTGLLSSLGLVLERPTGNGTDPSWFWAGDQGLFAQALGAGNRLAHQIAAAVIANMTDGSGVLHENLQYLKFTDLQTFEADYATGKGILMRNLLPVLMTAPAKYAGFIKTNATAVWCNRSNQDQFTYNWNSLGQTGEPRILRVQGKTNQLCDLIMQAAGLEALTAALHVAPDEQVACL